MSHPLPSNFIQGIADYRSTSQRENVRAQDIVRHCRQLKPDELPPIDFINTIGSDSQTHFLDVMCQTFLEFMTRFKLGSDSIVLDLGCGCGRMAFPFTYLLESGRYFGIDIWEAGINWCRQNITAVNKHIEFFCLNANNNYYFETFDETKPNDYKITFVDTGSVDFCFAVSLFTHLVEHDCVAYLHEISRVLAPDGIAYVTGFVIDDLFWKYVARTGRHAAVKQSSPGCYYAYSGQDFFAGYSTEKWHQMLKHASLRVISYEVGRWAEKNGARSFQDVFIVTPEPRRKGISSTSVRNLRLKRPPEEAIQEIFQQPLAAINYLCHWSKKNHFIYVETPKVACTTIKHVLQQAEVQKTIKFDDPSDVHCRSKSALLKPTDDPEGFLNALGDDRYFLFCFVRNPFTRILSCYLDKLVMNEWERQRLAPQLGLDPALAPSLLDFLRTIEKQTEPSRDAHWGTQTYLLQPNSVKYSFIGRFEFFTEQFSEVCAHMDINQYVDLSNRAHATNAKQKVRDYIGSEEAVLIREIYETDFLNFGYGWSLDVV
jgi:SAM-dependent methyltransferase